MKKNITLRDLKKIIMESDEKYVYIPLGLKADKDIVKKIMPEVIGNPSPWSILDDLSGQLSDGMWENSPQMDKYWNYFYLEDVGGELNLKVPTVPKKDYHSGPGTSRRWYIVNLVPRAKYFHGSEVNLSIKSCLDMPR